MVDLIQNAATWLSGVLQTNAGQSVTYRRGMEVLGLTVTVGKTEHRVNGEFGAVEVIESRDFVFPVADLVLGGVATEPERRDQILEVVGAKTLTYEVLPFGPNDRHFEFDRYRGTVRVFTKLVAEV